MVDETPSGRRIDVGVIRRVLAVCACMGLLDASAETYDVVGQCRAGVANGAYELRTPDGALRVVGAFSQGRMTGTFIFWGPGGARLAVLPFDNDARNGTVALWYTKPDGLREAGHKLEAPYVDDRLHGIKRAWYADGTLRAEVRYDHGTLLEAQGWTPAGAALPDAEARELALHDARAEEQTYMSLVALVRAHLPACEPSSPAKEVPRS
jgi:hypothetical protein